MFTVYVLKSLKNGKRYIGQTAKSAEIRMNEHNQGWAKWTKANGPFTLLYEEHYESRSDAMRRERELKSGQGRAFLDSIL